jgi:hypothetical protein
MTTALCGRVMAGALKSEGNGRKDQREYKESESSSEM